MKKLFSFFVAMIISFAAFTQAYSLRVENQTNCVQYYMIFGDEVCVCGDKYHSNLIPINPGNVHNYATSVPLGGTYPATPRSIVGAKIPNGPIHCQTQGGTVGEPNCGLTLTYTFVALNQDCRECARTTARWIPANNCQAMARLVFTP